MPVEIRLLNRYQLRNKENDSNELVLPVIELAPSGSNLAHISRITLSVRGTPPDLAAQIQSKYKDVSFSTPIKLSIAQRLKHTECKLDKPLPAGVRCTLQVSVEYFDSDAAGNPNQSVQKNVRAECELWSLSGSGTPQAPHQPKAEPAGNAPPSNQLPSAFPGGSLGTRGAENEKRKTQEINFPGWFAIDFGTSNSTVTLFDPRVVAPPDSLPKEQEQRLRERFAQWLNEQPTDALTNISASEWASEWEKFISDVSKDFKDLEITKPSRLGENLFAVDNTSRLLEAIRQIESCLSNRRDWFRKAASMRLNAIYHEVFRVPPLAWQNLLEVELDGDRRAREIPSELEIISLEPLNVLMGERAKQDRKDAIRTATSSSAAQIKGKFHHSPKRYFGQDRSLKLTLDGKEDTIAVNKLIQAAWDHLIKLTEACRQRYPGNFSVGRFSTAVVTYPTIAPPVVRREIEQLVCDLGIEDVQIAYDEAVSVAIFFLWREFGGDLNVGIESFKTRCHREKDKWAQNVLILDIGGGTTDLALIRLTLEEIDPFEENEDRGDGGRYYVITPKLLGASGHLQLGGELITLRIFLLLKAAIADCLLTAIAEESLESEVLKNRQDELSDRFLDNGKFQSGTLLARIDKENPESDSAAYKDALDAAEKILPTRWANSPNRLQTFYTLWEYADSAKLLLGQKTEDGLPPTFVLSEQEISNLLTQIGIEFQLKTPNSLSVTLNSQQFEKAATPAISEAIGIAKGLMERRLETASTQTKSTYVDSQSVRDKADSQNDFERVDWLILSGKTCNLNLVQREIYQEFSKSDYFVWNPERITFELEYTKLATSAGACYAEKLRRLIFDPKESKNVLRKGANQLYIDVKNLFYFLPCSFILQTLDGNVFLPIFSAGQELYQIDFSDSVAKARSTWYGVQLSIIIKRQDFEGMTPQLWGSFNGKALADKLGMNDFDFRNQIKVQFEIDYKLRFSLLLCRESPHYSIAADIPSLDAGNAIGTPAVFDAGKMICDIAVNVIESATAHKTDAHTVVFEAGKDYSKSVKLFIGHGGAMQEQFSGLISDTLPEFPLNGKHTFYFQFRDPNTNQWTRIGELPRPGGKTEFPCEYRVTLDDKGILRIHAGEIPYWTSESAECLKQEGCVYRAELELQPNDVDEKRDPFCGIH